MVTRVVSSAALLVLASMGSAAAQQPEYRALELTPSAGYMIFGKYLEGPVGTSIANTAGPLYGVQLDLNLSRNIGLYGHAGYASSDLEIGLPFLGGVSVGSTTAYLYDGGLELRAPMSRGAMPIVPFIQLGAGAIRHEIENDLLDVRATNTAINGGFGIDMQFTPSIGLRLLAKDYVGKFDFEEATAINVEGRTAHNIGLSIGLKVGF